MAIRAGVVVFETESGDITFANPRAASVLGQRLDALVGGNAYDLLASREALFAASDEERLTFEVELPDGSTRAIGATVSAIEADDSVAQSHVCLFQDISAFSRLRLERDRLLQIGALHAVLPTLLHELRNPIAAIETTLELLVEEAEGSDKQFDLHALLGEVRRVKLSLQGVGVAADLRANGYAVIDEAIADVVRVMARRAEQYGISVVAQVEAMPLLPFEPGVMRAVVFNLVDNAVTASPKGSQVTVSARLCTADVFELVVADQGRGMSDEVRERATELFYSTKRKGSGIGLALVKRAVSNSGGTMRVESKLDAGTTIKITLPTTTIERPTGLYRRLEDLTTPQ